MWNSKGALAVLITAAVLSVPLFYYWEYLTRGMRPPVATQKLNEMEIHGVPDFSIKDLSGTEVALKDYRGKLLLVNIWATWCAPCVKEFPSMKRLLEKFPNDLVILAVSYDRQREDIDAFVKAFGGIPLNFHIAWDREKRTTDVFGTDVLPETYIISRQGRLIRKIAGEATWDEPMAIEFFQDLVNAK
jgi:cytochrome c biogenesis protein CcmG/thiol:disulfide interchange protein DsbE